MLYRIVWRKMTSRTCRTGPELPEINRILKKLSKKQSNRTENQLKSGSFRRISKHISSRRMLFVDLYLHQLYNCTIILIITCFPHRWPDHGVLYIISTLCFIPYVSRQTTSLTSKMFYNWFPWQWSRFRQSFWGLCLEKRVICWYVFENDSNDAGSNPWWRISDSSVTQIVF